MCVLIALNCAQMDFIPDVFYTLMTQNLKLCEI